MAREVVMDVVRIQHRLREFASARDWEQFHSPKNLIMALTSEVGELAEIFQWMTEEQSRQLDPSSPDVAHAQEEVADVMICLLRIADLLRIDVEKAVDAKIDLNATRYPVDLSRGNAIKYSKR
jgi:dCTP diphosphatase